MHLGQKLHQSVTENETILHTVRRHPAGLIPIYFTAVVSIGIVYWVLKSFTNSENVDFISISDGVLGIILLSFTGLVLFVAYLSRQVYWASELILTDENVIQIIRQSLLSRDIARLNLGKVQDVSVNQRGFWQFRFNYGTLVIETAGEVASYKFRYCPDPARLASEIDQAHDDYIALHGLSKEVITGSP